jgi:hypothetical protein
LERQLGVTYPTAWRMFREIRSLLSEPGVYVDGDISTNTIEGVWSLVKRGIGGVHHSVSAKHLQSYLDGYAYRYSHRMDAPSMFDSMLDRLAEGTLSVRSHA